jgi:hypothetical protein
MSAETEKMILIGKTGWLIAVIARAVADEDGKKLMYR